MLRRYVSALYGPIVVPSSKTNREFCVKVVVGVIKKWALNVVSKLK
jgi:hypothetical protein